jgi:hypothetical protein
LTIKPDSKQDHFPNYSWKIVRKDDQIRFWENRPKCGPIHF